jgi:hypothetical protein
LGLEPGPRALKNADSPVALGELDITGSSVGDAFAGADPVGLVDPHAVIRKRTMTREPFPTSFTGV